MYLLSINICICELWYILIYDFEQGYYTYFQTAEFVRMSLNGEFTVDKKQIKKEKQKTTIIPLFSG